MRRSLPDLSDALVFDLDGTLADTLDDIAASVNHALATLSLPPRSRGEVRGFVGDGAALLVERALPAGRADLAGRALAVFREHYGAHLLDSTRPYDGISDALRALDRRGIPMAVLSNKPHDATETIVRSLFGGIRFGVVRGQRPGAVRKPDPGAVLEVVNVLGARPARCGLVGDGPADMQCARASGLRPIGVAWGFRDGTELLRHGASVVLDHPAELAGLA